MKTASTAAVDADVAPRRARLFQHLEIMLRIRGFELKLSDMFGRGEVRGTAHFCVGQEAVPTGVCAALREGDWISATHRGHGAALARGLDPYRMFAEIFGRRDGYCAGRGGSQHIACRELGFLGTNGITGGGLPIATGAALSARKQGRGQVAVAFFGDGAVNQGTFHESLNMAGIWRLPIVYVCENNLYSMSAAVGSFVAGGEIGARAGAYGIPYATIDGNDVELVASTAEAMVAAARRGEGPALLECLTYRQLGHSKSDQRKYRTPEEEAGWQKRDPILRACDRLRMDGAETATLDDLRGRVQAEIDAAADRALACPAADAGTLYDHLYGGPVGPAVLKAAVHDSRTLTRPQTTEARPCRA
jgi:pyruvate dehydrogenase E1 component alpha subunit